MNSQIQQNEVLRGHLENQQIKELHNQTFATQKIKELQNQTYNNQQEIQGLKKDIVVKELKIEELASQYNRQKDLGIQYVRGQNQLSNELNDMNKKYEEQKIRVNDLEKSNVELLSKNSKLEGLKNDIVVKELKIEELASQNTRIKEMNIQHVNGQNELAISFENKKEENANLRETLRKYKTASDSLILKIKEKDEKIDELGESNKALKESNEGLKEELATANKNITTFKNHHQQEVEDLKKVLDVKEGKVQELTSQYYRQKDLGIQYVRGQNQLSNELNDMNKKYEEQKIRVNDLEKSNVELLSKNSKLEERYNTTGFDIEQPRLRVRDNEEDLVMSIEEDNGMEEQEDNPRDEAEEETKEIQEAIETLASIKKDSATLTDKNLTLEKDNIELKDKLQESHIRKRKLEEDVMSSETENKKIKLEMVSTKEENQELKRLKELHLKSIKEKNTIIERKSDNLNLLLRQIRQQVKPDDTSE